MSQRERDVLKVLSNVRSRACTQVDAARLLGRSPRQVRRLLRRLERDGDAGIVHKLRGRASNNRTKPEIRTHALELVREHYAGFGPTLASEKLAEDHGIDVSAQTLRTWMLIAGSWKRQRDRTRHRSRRERRACFGEMVLADASNHDWLEGRGPRLTLVGMIDDATNRIELIFAEAETTHAYMDLLERWLGKHGRPRAWYSDRHGVFHAQETGLDGQKQQAPTQFSRALEQLEIELILARSPQAKGRIERLWGTAQDRLVKELRLAKASTLEEANGAALRKFVEWFNRKLTREAASATDAHRDLSGIRLSQVLCEQHVRVVSNDYTISFEGRSYQLLAPALLGERGGRVTIERDAAGKMRVRFKERYMEFREVGDSACRRGWQSRQKPAKKPEPRLSEPDSLEPWETAREENAIREENARPRFA